MTYYHTLRRLAFLPLLAGMLLLTACDSNEPDDDDGAGEEEVISLVRLTLTPQGGGASVTVDARFDEDAVLLSADSLFLTAGTTYDAIIDLQNTFEDPPESITAEIRDEEPEAHRFFYTVTGNAADNIAVSDLDTDPNGDPLGLTFDVAVTGGAGESGAMNVRLRHYEQEDEEDILETKRNDTATAPEQSGIVENDVDFPFPVLIN